MCKRMGSCDFHACAEDSCFATMSARLRESKDADREEIQRKEGWGWDRKRDR